MEIHGNSLGKKSKTVSWARCKCSRERPKHFLKFGNAGKKPYICRIFCGVKCRIIPKQSKWGYVIGMAAIDIEHHLFETEISISGSCACGGCGGKRGKAAASNAAKSTFLMQKTPRKAIFPSKNFAKPSKRRNFAPAKSMQGSLRLSVRTRDFHSLKRSSTLLGTTN